MSFNQIADRMFPGKYRSDFAVQMTSQIAEAQKFTINFANNNLLGSANFRPDYRTSKARVCVHSGHDDHRLRLHRYSKSRPAPPHLLAHRFCPDQGGVVLS